MPKDVEVERQTATPVAPEAAPAPAPTMSTPEVAFSSQGPLPAVATSPETSTSATAAPAPSASDQAFTPAAPTTTEMSTAAAAAPAASASDQAFTPAPASHKLLDFALNAAGVVGSELGLGAGVAVTAGLGLSKQWDRPLLDSSGRQVTINVDGQAFGLEQRHASIIGPKIAAIADRMQSDSALRATAKSLVAGFGAGATGAPPAEARIEGRIGAEIAKLEHALEHEPEPAAVAPAIAAPDGA